jgi:hypothetical protein
MGAILDRFPRVQLNFARFLSLLNSDKLFAILKARPAHQEFVFQLPRWLSYIHSIIATLIIA